MKLKHEHNTATRAILTQYGASGYGILWLIREAMAENGGTLPLEALDIVAQEAKEEPAIVRHIALNFRLFAVEGETITDAEQVAARQMREDAARKAADARWKKKPKRKTATDKTKTIDPNDNGVIVTVADIEKNATPTDLVKPTETPEELTKFEIWAQANTPYLANPRNIRQLTLEELRKLKEKFGTECIMATMQDLENRKDLRKKYSTLYFTLNNWCKNNKDKEQHGNDKQSFRAQDGRDAAKQSVLQRVGAIANGER